MTEIIHVAAQVAALALCITLTVMAVAVTVGVARLAWQGSRK